MTITLGNSEIEELVRTKIAPIAKGLGLGSEIEINFNARKGGNIDATIKLGESDCGSDCAESPKKKSGIESLVPISEYEEDGDVI